MALLAPLSGLISRLAIIAAFLVSAAQLPARAEADGPDHWRVSGVAADDKLNVRMGPGTNYLTIGSLSPDARGLQAITCVPYLTFGIFESLSEAQRNALPERWCMIFHQPTGTKGWVSGKFLTEDGDYSAAAAQDLARTPDGKPATVMSDDSEDPQMSEAMDLVSGLMTAVKAQEQGGPSPLQLPLARDFFFADMIPNIDPGKLGADPLVGGQDSMLEDITVEPDPDQPPLRGMYPVRATFTNFGQLRTVIFYLRVDTEIAPRMRILQFDADGVSYN